MVTINTTDDLLRALDENPRWQEAVRHRILTEELMRLPARSPESQSPGRYCRLQSPGRVYNG